MNSNPEYINDSAPLFAITSSSIMIQRCREATSIWNHSPCLLMARAKDGWKIDTFDFWILTTYNLWLLPTESRLLYIILLLQAPPPPIHRTHDTISATICAKENNLCTKENNVSMKENNSRVKEKKFCENENNVSMKESGSMQKMRATTPQVAKICQIMLILMKIDMIRANFCQDCE